MSRNRQRREFFGICSPICLRGCLAEDVSVVCVYDRVLFPAVSR